MSFLKRFPWLSFTLLLVSYIIFGKFLTTAAYSILPWSLALGGGLLLAIVLMNPAKGIQGILTSWFKSDTVAFTSLIGAAAFASIFLTWFKLFMPILMLISAESLARVDLQTSEFTALQSCCLLTATAWLGLGLGWAIAQVI